MDMSLELTDMLKALQVDRHLEAVTRRWQKLPEWVFLTTRIALPSQPCLDCLSSPPESSRRPEGKTAPQAHPLHTGQVEQETEAIETTENLEERMG
jgi:hypothetical protein